MRLRQTYDRGEFNRDELKFLKKYKDKYRTESIRLKGYDYSLEGSYFITICTRNRATYFGRVEEGRMILNSSGKVVANEWKRTADKRSRVILGEWIVMPNHFHAIIYLKPKNRRDASHASHDLSIKRDGFNPKKDGFNPSLLYRKSII